MGVRAMGFQKGDAFFLLDLFNGYWRWGATAVTYRYE